jgi:hypothetical protein
MAYIATKAKKTSYCSNSGGSTATQLYFYILDGGNATRLLCTGHAWLTLAAGRLLAHSQTYYSGGFRKFRGKGGPWHSTALTGLHQ